MEATKIQKTKKTIIKISLEEANNIINSAQEAFFETQNVNPECNLEVEEVEIYHNYVKFFVSYISGFKNYDSEVNDWDIINEKEVITFRFLDKRGKKLSFEEMDNDVYEQFCDKIKTFF